MVTMPKATLEEIAKRARVSRSTVSRVINDDPNVKPVTRERVRAVVQKFNYHPNLAARSLAAGRTRILGVVIPMGVSALFSDPYFPIQIQGISSACNVHDHSVMLWIADPEYERRTIRQILNNGLIDGVILASHLMNDPIIGALTAQKMPFILIGRHPNNSQIHYVDVDNIDSAHELVKHLIQRGYQRIATIAGPKNMIAGADRLQGYQLALQNHGMAPDPQLCVEGDFSENGGYEAMRQLIPQKPDAVFAASDTMALGAMRAIREANLRIPQDIALAGYDDMPFAARVDPPLTTVRQPVHRAGFVAAETLIDLVAHPGSPPRHIVLPTELIIRASTDPSAK
jgi:LacI family transcriptional regulator